MWVPILWYWEPRLVFRPHASQEEPPTPEISLWNLSHHLWDWVSSSLIVALPTSLNVASFVNTRL